MAEPQKKTVKLKDIAHRTIPIDISDTEQFLVRALNLREMVALFVESKDAFLGLYAAGIEGMASAEVLAPFLISVPEVVAKIIALASDEPNEVAAFESLPATVQLIALHAIWTLSVPDPKKAKELLSEVTVLLQKANDARERVEAGKTSSPTTSSPSLKPSSQPVTDKMMSGVTPSEPPKLTTV